MIFRRILSPWWLVALALPAAAQFDRAALNGTVTDTSGAVVPKANVEAVSLETGLRRRGMTGDTGTYQLPALPIGSYNLTISKTGFRSARIDDILLTVGEARTIDARLEIGTVSQALEVTASAEMVNRSSAEVSGVIGADQIRDMPSDGRNWAALMALAPGAIDDGGSDQRSIRFNGSSRDDNNFTFDGVDASGVQEGPQKSDARLNISLEAIAEFRVSTSVYTAESGSSAGAQVNVVSKTGTNQFHGGLFEFFRNEKLDTRSPFDPSHLPPFKMNQFGGSFGGPIRKNRTFFFTTYEGLRQRLGSTLIATVPSAAVRSQVSATSPALIPVINLFPIGQTRINANADQYSVSGINAAREDSGMLRVDHRFTDNTTAFVRYNTDSVDKLAPSGALGAHDSIAVAPTNLVLQLQHIFSPRVINETKFGLNRSAFTHRVLGVTGYLDISVSSFDLLPGNSLDEEIGTTFTYQDTLTVSRGRHTFKTGIDIRRIRLNNSGNAIDSGTVSFSSLANFIKDSVNTLGVNQAEGIHGLRRTFYMGFVQDEWKTTPQLTLNLGLRYEYYGVAHEVLDRAVVVDIPGCGGICPVGTPWYSPNTHDFGPRVGLAWAPAAMKGKTVIRTGFGIFYGGNQNDDFSDPMESTAGRYSVSVANIPSLSYPITPFLGELGTLGLSPKTIDRHRKDLYNENWNFNIQQLLPHSFLWQIGYVGSEGHYLFDRTYVNLLNPVTRLRPAPQFNQLLFKENQGNSNFNALQVSLQRPFKHGFLWQTQYMWSHAITDASVGAGEQVFFQDQSCRACDRSDSNLGARHTITMNSIYQLPFGHGRTYLKQGVLDKIVGNWNLSGLATARTGRPLNITISRSAAVMPDGFTSNQRPDLVYGVPLYPADQTINTWLNPAAFATPAKLVWGDLGRFIARGPAFYEIDTGLERQGHIRENLRLSFRAELFNLFNHPIYANPNASVSSASFGRITSILNTGTNGTGTPRRTQLMLRLEF